MPRPTLAAPCGSKSTMSTLRPYSASAAPRLIVVVVLPTPPFWLHIAMMRAGPWRSSGAGSAKPCIGRPTGSVACVVAAEVTAPNLPQASPPSAAAHGPSAALARGCRAVAHGPRVRGLVDLAQRVCGHERVQLGRRDRGVAEQLLDDAHVRPAVQQVGREGVAQGVRRDVRG